MNLLIAGLLTFMAAHLLPTVPSARAALIGRLGAVSYTHLTLPTTPYV